MEFIATELPGCYLVRPRVLEDARGFFIKTYHDGNFREAPVRVPFQEEYVTVSRKGVLRGLHFQVPPAALEKIVLCVHGAVLDAVVDLRVGSPTYKKHVLLELQGSGGEMIFVPKGCAHGFYALTDPAILIYKTSHVFRPECDKGIHWASTGIAWPEGSPVISGRDRVLPELAAFQSPFTYAGDS